MRFYLFHEVAQILGISERVLSLRVQRGAFPRALRKSGARGGWLGYTHAMIERHIVDQDES